MEVLLVLLPIVVIVIGASRIVASAKSSTPTPSRATIVTLWILCIIVPLIVTRAAQYIFARPFQMTRLHWLLIDFGIPYSAAFNILSIFWGIIGAIAGVLIAKALFRSRFSPIFGGYLWWTSPRGSVRYDIMVTLILAFVFLAPLWINFGDKPTVRAPHQTEIVVRAEGNGFVYKVDAAAVNQASDKEIRDSLLRVLEPVSGEITIDHSEPIRDSKHKIVAYQVWAHR